MMLTGPNNYPGENSGHVEQQPMPVLECRMQHVCRYDQCRPTVTLQCPLVHWSTAVTCCDFAANSVALQPRCFHGAYHCTLVARCTTLNTAKKMFAKFYFNNVHSSQLPSVFWRCWLGGRKGIRPVKNWVVGCWHSYVSGSRCRFAYGPADATATHYLLLQ